MMDHIICIREGLLDVVASRPVLHGKKKLETNPKSLEDQS